LKGKTLVASKNDGVSWQHKAQDGKRQKTIHKPLDAFALDNLKFEVSVYNT
jgi:hypothetical protein